MLLIRPWIRMNKYRITSFHIVFFIFIVSNIGGCLTPIGDPPLFLGFLRGVPFWWVLEHCWEAWLIGVGGLIAIFYVLDRRNFHRAPERVREEQTAQETWKFVGLVNLVFLAIAFVLIPETKNVSLEQIERNLMAGLPLREIGSAPSAVSSGFSRHAAEDVAS